jgi:hypothetical protein
MLGVAQRMGIWCLLFCEEGLFRRLFQSNLNHTQMNYLLFIWDVIVLFLNITELKLWSRNNIQIKEFIVFLQSKEKRAWST